MRLQILLALCASAVAAVFGNTTHEILTHKHTFVYDGYGAKACSNLGGKDGKLMLEYTPSDHIRFNESDGKCLIPSNSFKVNGITCEGSTVQTDLVAVSLEDLDGKYGDDSAAEFDAFTAVLRDFETRANDIDELVGLFAQRGTPVQCAYRHGRENEPLFLANLVFIIVGSSQNFSSGLLPNSAAWLDADRVSSAVILFYVNSTRLPLFLDSDLIDISSFAALHWRRYGRAGREGRERNSLYVEKSRSRAIV